MVEQGNLLPHSVPTEEILLGCLLTYSEGLDDVAERLPPQAFYTLKTRHTYRALLHLYLQDIPIDVLTVAHRLATEQIFEDETVAAGYLVSLIEQAAGSLSHYKNYATKVGELFIRREYIEKAERVASMAYDLKQDLPSIENVVDELFVDSSDEGESSFSQISTFVDEAVSEVDEAQKAGTGLVGVATGFKEIDEKLGGLPQSLLTSVLADTSIGKTQFVMQLAENVAGRGEPVLVFSMEILGKNIAARVLTSQANVTWFDLRRGRARPEEYERFRAVAEKVKALPIYVDDSPMLSARDIQAKTRKYVLKYGIKMVIVDYLQLLISDYGSAPGDYSTIATAMRILHTIPRRNRIPVILVVNAHRGLHGREDKRPDIIDGHGGGFIEKMTSVYLSLYRHNQYFPEVRETEGIGEVTVMKNTEGPAKFTMFLPWANGRWGLETPTNMFVNVEDIPGFEEDSGVEF